MTDSHPPTTSTIDDVEAARALIESSAQFRSVDSVLTMLLQRLSSQNHNHNNPVADLPPHDDGGGGDESATTTTTITDAALIAEMTDIASAVAFKYSKLCEKVPSYTKVDMWYQIGIPADSTNRRNIYRMGAYFLERVTRNGVRDWYNEHKDKIKAFIRNDTLDPIHTHGISARLASEYRSTQSQLSSSSSSSSSASSSATFSSSSPPLSNKRKRSSLSLSQPPVSVRSNTNTSFSFNNNNSSHIFDPIVHKLTSLVDQLTQTRDLILSNEEQLTKINEILTDMVRIQEQKASITALIDQLRNTESQLTNKLETAATAMNSIDV